MGCDQSTECLALAIFTPEELGTAIVLRMGGIAFEWLSNNAVPSYHAIQRWWGGPVARERAEADYRNARSLIIHGIRDNDERLQKIADLRECCRNKYPQYSHLWN